MKVLVPSPCDKGVKWIGRRSSLAFDVRLLAYDLFLLALPALNRDTPTRSCG